MNKTEYQEAQQQMGVAVLKTLAFFFIGVPLALFVIVSIVF